MKASRLLNFYFLVQEMGGSSSLGEGPALVRERLTAQNAFLSHPNKPLAQTLPSTSVGSGDQRLATIDAAEGELGTVQGDPETLGAFLATGVSVPPPIPAPREPRIIHPHRRRSARGRRFIRQKGASPMVETLYVLAAAATIAGFLMELGCKLFRLIRRRSARKRMVQEEVVGNRASE